MKRSLAIRITERDLTPADLAHAAAHCPPGGTPCPCRLDIVATGFTDTGDQPQPDFSALLIPIVCMLNSMKVPPAQGQSLITHAIAENIAETRAERTAEAILTQLNTPTPGTN